MSRADGGSPLQTVDRALQILELFSPVAPDLSVAQVARALDVDRSIASRLLSALAMRRMVVQDPETSRFRLGVRTLELGALFVQSHRLVTAATPYLNALGKLDGPGLVANLFILDDGQALRLTSYPARPLTRLHVPANCTAAGKVLLAALDEAEFDRLIQDRGLPAQTPNSIVDLDELRTCLDEVRRRGYATDTEEIVLGSHCFAAPVRDATGRTVGAVSIGVQLGRAPSEEQAAVYVDAVRDAGHLISECLGSGALTTGGIPFDHTRRAVAGVS